MFEAAPFIAIATGQHSQLASASCRATSQQRQITQTKSMSPHNDTHSPQVHCAVPPPNRGRSPRSKVCRHTITLTARKCIAPCRLQTEADHPAQERQLLRTPITRQCTKPSHPRQVSNWRKLHHTAYTKSEGFPLRTLPGLSRLGMESVSSTGGGNGGFRAARHSTMVAC